MPNALTEPALGLSSLPARERILRTAHDLFYREGIRATGIDRVIAESGVTKVTFYRHFPSKNDLVLAFLEYRHVLWMDWFRAALQRHGGKLQGLPTVLGEWFRQPVFRGCAFINSVGELGGTEPQVREIAQRHKQDMTEAIASLLPPSRRRKQDALTIALAVDGAIVRAQTDAAPEPALRSLSRLLRALATDMEAASANEGTDQ
ncbi:TetR family transcriptional regulator [Hylemonella gracilis str. Niagara R]|uniref:TetR family transcriptional regulator n=1 Tax=Hylemonella gracilis str. Niagara R TaxID=1458275 RepID=A0A016XDV3_9BURK|nr:TetR/AcrR family transcriptional regulator [Hylemonella gracilis]EYC49767.1 TetR family transcriptional regulator [Hylemonella gracilis str. Niagara R]